MSTRFRQLAACADSQKWRLRPDPIPSTGAGRLDRLHRQDGLEPRIRRRADDHGRQGVRLAGAVSQLPQLILRPQLLVTPTNDIGKLLSALNKSQIGGLPQLSTAVQIAQLALKHRENKNQRQRIVVFVGSPLEDSQDSLVKLGKRLRKNNVLVDVVTFGEEGMGNDEKLGALVEAAGAGDS